MCLDLNELFCDIDNAKTVEHLKDVCKQLLDKISELENDIKQMKEDEDYNSL